MSTKWRPRLASSWLLISCAHLSSAEWCVEVGHPVLNTGTPCTGTWAQLGSPAPVSQDPPACTHHGAPPQLGQCRGSGDHQLTLGLRRCCCWPPPSASAWRTPWCRTPSPPPPPPPRLSTLPPPPPHTAPPPTSPPTNPPTTRPPRPCRRWVADLLFRNPRHEPAPTLIIAWCPDWLDSSTVQVELPPYDYYRHENHHYYHAGPPRVYKVQSRISTVTIRAANEGPHKQRRFVITEKAPTRAFSW